MQYFSLLTTIAFHKIQTTPRYVSAMLIQELSTDKDNYKLFDIE